MTLHLHAPSAVPFWLTWSICGIGETYFYFLPPVYHAPGFWACVGLFMVTSIIKATFVPKFASVDNSSKSGEK